MRMAKEEDYLIKKFGIEKPFKTPDGYFDSFTDKVMSNLPERTFVEEIRVVTLWDRVKPLVYLAAMFAGIAAMFAIAEDFVGTDNKEQLNLVSTTQTETEVFQAVYSDEAADYCNYLMKENDMDDYSMYLYLENVVE